MAVFVRAESMHRGRPSSFRMDISDDTLTSRYDNAWRPSKFPRSSSDLPQLGILEETKTNDQIFHQSSEEKLGSQKQKPKDFLGQLKFYYDKYQLQHALPFIVLTIYSLIGAALFCWIERAHEQELIRKEKIMLDQLRNDTCQRLRRVFRNRNLDSFTNLINAKKILLWHESQLNKLKITEGLEWDMWGALFYVGTIFTTIGYGNIAPRTVGGQVLSMVYAIFGIPLVLAILSHFGKTLTTIASNFWMRYQECIQNHARKRQKKTEKWKYMLNLPDIEKGKVDQNLQPLNGSSSRTSETTDDEQVESRTIPVWLALFICICWICVCAGLFCLWETRWSYFTSLYFFFISLSTIGLGDVVPDHPHMLILMFWLVIIGLSIVSMLLSVIQIKFEEWLYHLMIRMQKEYQRALACGDPVKRDEILKRLMAKEPWFARNMAQHLISEKQAAQLDKQAETYERSMRILNNKNIQTEGKFFDESVFSESNKKFQDTDRSMNVRNETDLRKKEVNPQCNENVGVKDSTLRSASNVLNSASNFNDDANSVSDVTSLPIDYINLESIDRSVQAQVSLADQEQQIEPCAQNGCAVQTDIAQFQVDEIMLKLHDLQASIRPKLTDRSVETSLDDEDVPIKQKERIDNENSKQLAKDSEHDKMPLRIDVSTATEELLPELVLFHRSMETDAWMSQIQTPECSRAVQTTFDDHNENIRASDSLARRKKARQGTDSAKSFFMDKKSTQNLSDAKDMCDTAVQTVLDMKSFNPRNLVEKGCNTSKLDVKKDDASKPKRQDLVIQTDSSYLKIARRLDQMRTNRTESLHICMANPLKQKDHESVGSKHGENLTRRRGQRLSNRRKKSVQNKDEQIVSPMSVPKKETTQNDHQSANFSSVKHDVS